MKNILTLITCIFIIQMSMAQTIPTTSQKKITDQSLIQMYADIQTEFARLRPQVIHPAQGYIKLEYLVPAGFYQQMWDWDGFFIGNHLASIGQPQYLKYWTLNFASGVDAEGYVPGCFTEKGPRPIFGKFAMKPFLAQGAYLSAKALDDFSWIEPVWESIKKVISYREKTQFDPNYGLFFWDNAMQSGADNNPALTNDEHEPSAILGVDINIFQYREYLAMALIAGQLGKKEDIALFTNKAEELRANILAYHWDPESHMMWNVRRRDGRQVKRVSYSNFIVLMQKDILPREEGRAMIRKYLWNTEHMLAPYGIRSLSKQDPDYNNECIIIPYSNWQGPVWPIANYLYFIGLKNYGFDKECRILANTLGNLMLRDILTCGSMHETYHADTGAPLAPTAAQSKDGIFTGFVGWNLLVQNMLAGVVEEKWMLLEIE
jgi:alpha,alpha-trehalase